MKRRRRNKGIKAVMLASDLIYGDDRKETKDQKIARLEKERDVAANNNSTLRGHLNDKNTEIARLQGRIADLSKDKEFLKQLVQHLVARVVTNA